MRPSLAASVASVALALALAGCATTAPGSAASGPQASVRQAVTAEGASSPYGAFLAGQVAINSGDSGRASEYFGRAARLEPTERAIRERAFTSALMAGDVAAAVRAAPAEGEGAAAEPLTAAAGPPRSSAELATLRAARDAARSATSDALARLTRAVDDLAAGRGREADAALAGEFGAHGAAASLLKPWAAAAAGDWDRALSAPEASGAAANFQNLTRALLLERRGRRAEADAAFEALGAGGDFTLLTVARGEYLERTGRRAEALALYDAAVARGDTNASLLDAQARARAGGRAPERPSLQAGAARSLLLPAVTLVAADQREAGLLYMRLVLRLDPQLHDGWVLTGDTLVQMEDYEGARRAYAEVPAGSPLYGQAQSRIVGSLQSEERVDEALRLAQAAVVRAPQDVEVRLALAGVQLEREDYAAAAQALDGLSDDSNWRVAYLRGAALERAGRWPEAEASLQAALRQRPDEPELLNHLGYAWIDRGVRLEEATAMLDRAMQARPESGAIVDSVGWARYRLGRYGEAVGLLERAVQLEPGDPTVNDHLGDAYWRVGRRVEARFQWRHALGLEPDADLRRAAEAKLASDLGPDAAGAVATASAPAAERAPPAR